MGPRPAAREPLDQVWTGWCAVGAGCGIAGKETVIRYGNTAFYESQHGFICSNSNEAKTCALAIKLVRLVRDICAFTCQNPQATLST